MGQGAVDAGAYPKNFMTLKLGGIALLLHQKPGALMLPMGSWYTAGPSCRSTRAANRPILPLAIMQFPAMDGGAAITARRSPSRQASRSTPPAAQGLAAAFLNAMRAGDGQALARDHLPADRVKTEGGRSRPYAAYFKELIERDVGAKFFIECRSNP